MVLQATTLPRTCNARQALHPWLSQALHQGSHKVHPLKAWTPAPSQQWAGSREPLSSCPRPRSCLIVPARPPHLRLVWGRPYWRASFQAGGLQVQLGAGRGNKILGLMAGKAWS